MMMNFNFFNPFENSQLVLGQHHDSPPFIGRITNMLLFLNPLGDQEIRRLAQNYDIDEILKKTVFVESMKSFLDETRVPGKSFTGLNVAEEFFERVEEEKAGEPVTAQRALHAREIIAELFCTEEYYQIRDKVDETLQPGKYEYLMKVCALMSSGEGNFEGHILLSRFMTALYYIKSPLTADEVWLLATESKLGKIEIDEEKKKFKMLHFQAFLRALRRSLPELEYQFTDAKTSNSFGMTATKKQYAEQYDDLDSECSDEIDERAVDGYKQELINERIEAQRMKCSAYENIEIDSFDGVENGYLQEENPEDQQLKYKWQQNVRETEARGRQGEALAAFDDMTETLMSFPSMPLMKRIDFYYSDQQIYGFEVVYRGDPLLGRQ